MAKQRLRQACMETEFKKPAAELGKRYEVEGKNFDLGHGDVVIAAITSCTNTSNPSVMIARRPPGQESGRARPQGQALGEDLPRARLAGRHRLLTKSGLQKYLDKLGFNLVGYRLHDLHRQLRPAAREDRRRRINDNDLVAAAVLSGNRNFEGRVNPDVRANYLASPPLVVAYALAGIDARRPDQGPLGTDKNGKPVYLKDIWPTSKEIDETIRKTRHQGAVPRASTPTSSRATRNWRKIKVAGGMTYRWDTNSTYVQNPPYFEGMTIEPEPVKDIVGARILGLFLRLDHHRPHLARPARSRRVARGQVPDGPPGRGRPTSTSTARAAATTRS